MTNIGETPVHPSTLIVLHSPEASVAKFGPNFPRFQKHIVWIRLSRDIVHAKDFEGCFCIISIWSASSCNGEM